MHAPSPVEYFSGIVEGFCRNASVLTQQGLCTRLSPLNLHTRNPILPLSFLGAPPLCSLGEARTRERWSHSATQDNAAKQPEDNRGHR